MNSNDSELLQNNVERLAYKLWEERGRPDGSPEEDWHHAEREVAALDQSSVSSAAALVTGQ